jgi:hypothetical protein
MPAQRVGRGSSRLRLRELATAASPACSQLAATDIELDDAALAQDLAIREVCSRLPGDVEQRGRTPMVLACWGWEHRTVRERRHLPHRRREEEPQSS